MAVHAKIQEECRSVLGFKIGRQWEVIEQVLTGMRDNRGSAEETGSVEEVWSEGVGPVEEAAAFATGFLSVVQDCHQKSQDSSKKWVLPWDVSGLQGRRTPK